ncbi:MAG: hypothetical protein LBQ87_03765 [Candidatus Fibromonas sp.]|nr:hypothetical protein [Candidatus Fibromonas sp.]
MFMLSIASQITKSLDNFIPVVSEIEFTRIVEGKTSGLQRDSSVYSEKILVKHIPKDFSEQSKIMIAYFDSVGLSISDLSKMPEIKYYDMSFYKSTYATRKYFVEEKDVPYSERKRSDRLDETYLGDVSISRCKNDAKLVDVSITRYKNDAKKWLKWLISTDRTLGRADEEFIIEIIMLLNECGSVPYIAKENKELVKYYMELRDKNNAKD